MTEKAKEEQLYKVLGAKGESCNGGKGKWHLPSRGKPGKWMPQIKTLVPCQSGYHVCTIEQLPGWFGPRIYRVEVRGKRIEQDDKIVAEQARLISRCTRWNNKTAGLFACDCAERALRHAKVRKTAKNPSWEAIRVARLFAERKATQKQLAAARDAGWAAARNAARAAARAAGWAAARDAARDAEHKWQTEQLRKLLEGK